MKNKTNTQILITFDSEENYQDMQLMTGDLTVRDTYYWAIMDQLQGVLEKIKTLPKKQCKNFMRREADHLKKEKV